MGYHWTVCLSTCLLLAADWDVCLSTCLLFCVTSSWIFVCYSLMDSEPTHQSPCNRRGFLFLQSPHTHHQSDPNSIRYLARLSAVSINQRHCSYSWLCLLKRPATHVRRKTQSLPRKSQRQHHASGKTKGSKVT